jgi:hypothetical protein
MGVTETVTPGWPEIELTSVDSREWPICLRGDSAAATANIGVKSGLVAA